MQRGAKETCARWVFEVLLVHVVLGHGRTVHDLVWLLESERLISSVHLVVAVVAADVRHGDVSPRGRRASSIQRGALYREQVCL